MAFKTPRTTKLGYWPMQLRFSISNQILYEFRYMVSVTSYDDNDNKISNITNIRNENG